MRILNVFKKKYILGLIICISILLNILFIFFANSPIVPISRQIAIGSYAPSDTTDTLYLAHGVIVFQDKTKQSKNFYQILTFYLDAKTGDAFAEQSFLMNGVLTPTGRDKLEILSYDKDSKILILTGAGWKKVIIDGDKKEVVEATDTTGDIVYLKSSWEI